MENVIGTICGLICGACMAVILGVSVYYITKVIDGENGEDEAEAVSDDDSAC